MNPTLLTRGYRGIFLMCLAFLLSINKLYSQSEAEPNYWNFLGESETFVDVNYRIVECGGQNQVHLYLLNENSYDQTANFELTFTSGGETYSHVIKFDLPKGDLRKVDGCDAEPSLDPLRFDLPEEMDPSNLEVVLTFVE